MRHIRYAALLLALVATPVAAINRVGDADNDGDVDPLDAARVQARVYGSIDEFSISPLALADANGDLDLKDMMLVAQAASGARVITGPGGWLSFVDPPALFAESGDAPVNLLWGVYSNFIGVAENTDGMGVTFSVLPAGAESTVAPPLASVSGWGVLAQLTPMNTTGIPKNVAALLTLDLQDSGGAALSVLTRNALVQVAPSACGNDRTQPGEQCDDGNANSDDGCGPTCQVEFCGDGITQGGLGEVCDDAASNGLPNSCNATCDGMTIPVCGNGIAESGESCDDGPDGSCFDDCSAFNTCGDSIPFDGEVCDDGPGGSCFDDCTAFNTCGDAIPFDGEVCDDGLPEGPGLCLNDCSGLQVCGDGQTNGTEGCDDFGKCDGGQVCGVEQDCTDAGSANCLPRSGDGCAAGCVLEYCGDGIVNNDTTAYGVTVNGMWMDVGGGVRQLKDGWFDPGNILIPDSYNYGMTIQTDAALAVLEAVAGVPTPTGQQVAWAIDRYDLTGPGDNSTCNGAGLGPNGMTYSGVSPCARYHSVLRGSASLSESLSGGSIIVQGTLVNDGFFHWVTSPPTALPPEVQTLYAYGEFDSGTRLGFMRMALQPIELESCDEGPLNAQPNQCDSACTGITPPVCGNGVVEAGETCDDGPGGSCLDDCTALNICGDGIPFNGEFCDDGSGGSCFDDCTAFNTCGDGIQFNGEVCDTSGNSSACDSDCTLPSCGDGLVNSFAGEACDNGATNSDTTPDACRTTCSLPWCGDGVVDSIEVCDDGPGGTCLDDCAGPEFLSVSAGRNHACGIRGGNTVACWGSMGDVPGIFQSVSSNDNFSCGLLADSTLTCWGSNEYGKATPPIGTFISISTGEHHACAVRTNNTLACWGYNASGQASPPSGQFISVSAGEHQTCGLRADSTIACWGLNILSYEIPTGTFLQISVHNFHACGVRTDNTVACWLGGIDGAGIPLGGTFLSVSAGGWHTCGVRTDGTLACWGSNLLVGGGWGGQATPPGGQFLSVSSGYWFTCGVRIDNSVVCWGSNASGQLNVP